LLLFALSEKLIYSDYQQFSSVQLQNLCFTQSYNENYDGCADAYSNYEETFQFSAGQRTVRVSVMSSWFPGSGGRLFHANGPATEKLRGPKPDVLVRGTTRSPWPAERKWRRV